MAPQPVRNGLLLRLFLGTELGVERCRVLIDDYRQAVLDRLTALAAARADIEAGTDSDPHSRRYRLLTVSFGEHTARGQLAWADESLALLAEPPDRRERPDAAVPTDDR